MPAEIQCERVKRTITMNKDDWDAIQLAVKMSSHQSSGSLLADTFRFWMENADIIPEVKRKLDIITENLK